MTDIIRSRIKEVEGTNRAADPVLFSLAEQEDSLAEYEAQIEN